MNDDAYEELTHCQCDRCVWNGGDWQASGHRIMHVYRAEHMRGWWVYCRACRQWIAGPDEITYRQPTQQVALQVARRHINRVHWASRYMHERYRRHTNDRCMPVPDRGTPWWSRLPDGWTLRAMP